MRVAVIGAGINGVMCAWALADARHAVVLFERGQAMAQTSSRSSKLLHGGLRYLEHGHFALVREGLRERGWWLASAPHLAHRIEIVIPVYRGSPRSRLALRLGLIAYDLFAGAQRLGWHGWLSAGKLHSRAPELHADGLIGGFSYFDGQMDDRALGLWALARARAKGVELREHTPVDRIDTQGEVTLADGREKFDFIVNAAGPWAARLNENSGIASAYRLDLVRGSHLVVGRRITHGYLLQSAEDGRVCFALPYRDYTLVGTTEVRQSLDEPIACSDTERDYLLRTYNGFLQPALSGGDIVETFSGVRPLVAAGERTISRASREYALERRGRLLTVYGGKWTTARSLGQNVARTVNDVAMLRTSSSASGPQPGI
jgi:glycerol-3-phosphate dehydrogenase